MLPAATAHAAEFITITPDLIDEEELQNYLQHRRNVKGLAPEPCASNQGGSGFSSPRCLDATGAPSTIVANKCYFSRP